LNREDARQLLDQIGVLKHACDVDLLVFFARHPRTLLTSEQLAAWLGYDLKQIAESLEMLLEAGLLTRTQNPTHAARMYIFAVGKSYDWIPPLLELASTRAGRLAVREELSRRASKETDSPAGGDARQRRASMRPRPIVAQRQLNEISRAKVG
jgi:hypothetical protein